MKPADFAPKDVERFMAKVDVGPGCWLWTAAISSTGYGNFSMWPRYLGAHRAAYLMFVGEIPEGLDLDHLCRVRACVNPLHLEPVTRRVNTLRGETLAAENAAKSECLRGHPYDETNTYRGPDGRRSCLTCRREILWPRFVAARAERRSAA